MISPREPCCLPAMLRWTTFHPASALNTHTRAHAHTHTLHTRLSRSPRFKSFAFLQSFYHLPLHLLRRCRRHIRRCAAFEISVTNQCAVAPSIRIIRTASGDPKYCPSDSRTCNGLRETYNTANSVHCHVEEASYVGWRIMTDDSPSFNRRDNVVAMVFGVQHDGWSNPLPIWTDGYTLNIMLALNRIYTHICLYVCMCVCVCVCVCLCGIYRDLK